MKCIEAALVQKVPPGRSSWPAMCAEITAERDALVTKLEKEKKALEETVTHLTARRAELEETVTHLNAREAAMEKSVQQIKEDNAVLQMKNAQLQQDISAIQQEKQDLQQELISKGTTIQSLKSQVSPTAHALYIVVLVCDFSKCVMCRLKQLLWSGHSQTRKHQLPSQGLTTAHASM